MSTLLPVRTKTLKPNIQLGFDLYIQLPTKLVRFAHANDDVPNFRFDRLNEKKVRKLFRKS